MAVNTRIPNVLRTLAPKRLLSLGRPLFTKRVFAPARLFALALLPVSAFLLVSCAGQLALPDDGTGEETSPEALVGQPIQMGNALSASAMTRAGGEVSTDSDFPQVGSTMTVFLTIPAADTPDHKPRRLQANYTCTRRTYDDATHAVTSATWTADATDGNETLCWQYADARHIFAAISPAAADAGTSPGETTGGNGSVTPLTLTEYPVNDAGGTASPLPAAVFTLPAALNEQSFEYWRSLRTTYQACIVEKPTTAPVVLKMRKALTEVEIISNELDKFYPSAMLYQVPRTAFFNPTTGEVTALRTGITATLSGEGGATGGDKPIPDYAIGGELAPTGNITAYAADALGVVHHALLPPTAYHESGDNRCDGSGTLSYILTDFDGKSYVYRNDIPAGMDANGIPAHDGGFCPGSVLQIMDNAFADNGYKLLHCDGTYTGATKVINALNALKESDGGTVVSTIFLTGPLGGREQEIMQALAGMVQAKGTDVIYVEQAREITDGLFKDCGKISLFFPKVTVIGSKISAGTENVVNTAYLPNVKTIAPDAFSGCKISELYLSGVDENGSFFLPKYSKDENTRISDLHLINLPQDYFKAASGGELLDDERLEQLEKCMEFIGTKDSSDITTGEEALSGS